MVPFPLCLQQLGDLKYVSICHLHPMLIQSLSVIFISNTSLNSEFTMGHVSTWLSPFLPPFLPLPPSPSLRTDLVPFLWPSKPAWFCPTAPLSCCYVHGHACVSFACSCNTPGGGCAGLGPHGWSLQMPGIYKQRQKVFSGPQTICLWLRKIFPVSSGYFFLYDGIYLIS